MLKITLPLLIFIIANMPFPIYADQIDNIIDMSITQMKKDMNLGSITKCLGIPKSKMLQQYRKIFRYCFDKHGIEDDSGAINGCLEQQRTKQLGISESDFAKCANQSPEEDEEPPVDLANMSPEESINNMLEMSKALSKGTEHLITLPIYQPSEIISHYVKGMTTSSGKQTLSIASFGSSSNIKQVVDFYKKKLPTFEVNTFDDNNYTFMKKIPRDFDRMSMDFDNMPLFFIPHITISKLNIDGKAIVNIAITYQKK